MDAATLSIIAVTLLVGHEIGDHIVQTDRAAGAKTHPGVAGVKAMATHLIGYGAAQLLLLLLLVVNFAAGTRLSVTAVAAGMAVSLGTHALIDRRKLVVWLLEHTGSTAFAAAAPPFGGRYLADQALHRLCCLVSALIIAAVG